jgi:hypothetical protein
MKWKKPMLALFLCAVPAWGGEAVRPVSPSQKSQLVRDLRATRKGDSVALTWSSPPAITNRPEGMANLAVAHVCRNILPAILRSRTALDSIPCGKVVGKVSLQGSNGGVTAVNVKNSVRGQARFIDTLPEDQKDSEPLRFAVYRIELLDDRGRSAGFSNPAWVPLAPTPAPEGLHSELDVRGVYLIWEPDDEIAAKPSSLQFDFRVYRREKGSSTKVAVPYMRAVVHTRDGDRWTGVDTTIQWEKTYSYWVTTVTKIYSQDGRLIGEIEGSDSAPLEITTHNVFPPAAPERLLAMPSEIPKQKFVDLLWAPNVEKDIAKYNVYRREEGGEAVRIGSVPGTVLSFQDKDVAAAHRYFYRVSAVDKRGNESAKSQEESAGVR